MTTTLELAKQAGFDEHHARYDTRMEAFRALCVAERDKELMALDMKPVAVVRWNDIGHISWRTYVMLTDDTKLYTETHLAVARLQGQEEGRQMAQIDRVNQRIKELEAQLKEKS